MKIHALVFALLLGVPAVTPLAQAASGPTADRGFADLAKKVSPAVVNISTFARPRMGGRSGMMSGEDLFRRFFEEFYGGRMPPGGRPGPGPGPEEEDAPVPPKGKAVPFGLGSGFIIDANEGLILTNFHVIQGAEEVKVQLKEEEADLILAEVIGRDPELDIALLKLKSKTKLTAIALGDSDAIDVGEYVIAIGNPLGYGHTVTHGILSAKGRRNPEFRLGKYLQTDASINPGNSGGPLINMKGEVIGINNAIDARGQAIGFAIPINAVKSILPELKAKGTVTRGFLGVTAADLTPDVAEQLKIDPKLRGVVISDVGRGTPAEKAGLKPYDVITAVNKEKVMSASDLTLKIVSVPVGGEVTIQYVRGGKEKETKAKVAERPTAGAPIQPGRPPREPAPRGTKIEDFGFEVAELNERNAREFGIPENEAKNRQVVVTDLDYGKAAAAAGLGRGDIILDVAGKPIKTVSDITQALEGKKGKSILIRIKRFDRQGSSAVSVVVLGG